MTDLPGHASPDHDPVGTARVDAPINLPGPARVVSIIRPSDPGGCSPTGEPDGRTARRGRNREAVIRAMMELIEEGELDPATARIADRAGVSHRSLFRYFDDLGDLAREAINIAFAEAVEHSNIPDIGQGPLGHRIDAIVASRVNVYSRTYNPCRVVRFKSGAIEELDRALTEIAGLLRVQLQRQFAAELAAKAEDERDPLLDTMLVMTDFVPYDIQRRMLGYDDERIARTWRYGLTVLLS